METPTFSPRDAWRRLRRWQQAVLVLAAVAGVSALLPTQPTAQLPAAAAAAASTSTSTTAPTTTTHPTTTSTSPPPSTTSSTTSTTAPPTTTTLPAPTTTSTPPTAVPTGGVVVTRVVDGDTVYVTVNGASESLRLIGINSPENGECFSDEAAARLGQLVEGQTVTLGRDESDRDQYGRLLRYVYVGDVFVNEVLVREGYAIARRYEPDTAMAGVLEAAQAVAEAARVGMWAPQACGEAPAATIAVSEIHYNAAGDDNTNLNDEWVAFTNEGSATVDLTGWSVKDESASHRYSFPAGFELAAGATVRLHTGCGEDSATALHWCNQGSAVWNNGGDTVFLLDPSGNIAVSRHYDA